MSSFVYAPRKQRSATTMDIIQEGLKKGIWDEGRE